MKVTWIMKNVTR